MTYKNVVETFEQTSVGIQSRNEVMCGCECFRENVKKPRQECHDLSFFKNMEFFLNYVFVTLTGVVEGVSINKK